MLLDLALDPADAARLSRVRRPAGARAGRARGQAIRLVWHDTADAAWLARGLALVERRDGMRLERARPGDDFWPPGAPPPPLPPPGNDPPSEMLPKALIGWAAFEGRATVRPIDADGGTLTVLHGTLRTVAHTRETCRVGLDGPESVIGPLALAIAGELRLSVPRASLADEAMALARGADPPARRLGAPVLTATTVGDAFADVIGHLTDALLHWASRVSPEAQEPVHQARVAMRRLRSALGVFRRAVAGPDIDAVAAGLRTLAGLLGPARDWDVFMVGAGGDVGRAFADDPAIERLLRAAERRRRDAYGALTAYLDGPAFRVLGLRLALLAGGGAWRDAIPADIAAAQPLHRPLAEYAAGVLARRLKRLLDAGEDIDALPAPALHAVRLDGKRLRYAAEFFTPLFPGKAARRFLRRLERLQERLGAVNDGAVAAELMAELGGGSRDHAYAVGAVRGFVAAESAQARPHIARAWLRMRRQEPFWP